MKWKTDRKDLKEIIVKVKTNHGHGAYRIWATKRPEYCDRGDWSIGITSGGASDLDDQDGFPRYFFGDGDAVKAQIETWISRRKETVKDQ
jgi:hypothetical protein